MSGYLGSTPVLITPTVTSASGDFDVAGGITLGGGSDKLLVYDEGTWTPTYQSEGGIPNTTGITINHARYTRIGRQVTCDFNFELTTSSSETIVQGDYIILNGSSLPFAIMSSIPAVSSASGVVHFYGSYGSGTNAFGTIALQNDGDMILGVLSVDGTPATGSSIVMGTFTYFTDE